MNFLPVPPEYIPVLIVAIPLFGAFLTPIISRINGKVRNIFAISILGITGFLVFWLSTEIFTNNMIYTYVFGGDSNVIGSGNSAYAIRILFEVDSFGIFMAIIAIIVAFIGTLYSYSYMKKETGLDKYYTLILLMTAGMMGMLLTGDLFNFFVFLEITGISSAALVAFWIDKKYAVEAGFKYIIISAIGALFVLLAIALLYGQYNALNMSVLANAITNFNLIDQIILILLFSALAMKAGIVPMHMWLPDAYGRAPASISIMLVGATLSSLYAVFRVIFTLYGKVFLSVSIQTLEFVTTANILGGFIVLLAVLTMLVGVIMALKQNNLKRLIAFAALAEIGYMILGLGIRLAAKSVIYDTEGTAISILNPAYTQAALTGSIFHILNDALDVGLLFLVAGAIYYATKETSLDRMGGLARNMKYTTIFFLIGLFAMSGMPPLNGFTSKIIIYESAYQLSPLVSIIAILSSIMLLACFVKVFHSAFLGPKQPHLKNVKEVPKTMLVAMGLIAILIIIIGLFPNLVIENAVKPTVDAILNNTAYISAIIGGA